MRAGKHLSILWSPPTTSTAKAWSNLPKFLQLVGISGLPVPSDFFLCPDQKTRVPWPFYNPASCKFFPTGLNSNWALKHSRALIKASKFTGKKPVPGPEPNSFNLHVNSILWPANCGHTWVEHPFSLILHLKDCCSLYSICVSSPNKHSGWITLAFSVSFFGIPSWHSLGHSLVGIPLLLLLGQL